MVIAISTLIDFKTGRQQIICIIAVTDLIIYDAPIPCIFPFSLNMTNVAIFVSCFFKGKRISFTTSGMLICAEAGEMLMPHNSPKSRMNRTELIAVI